MTNDPYLQVIKAYASNSSWIIGFLMDIFGAVLMLLALSQAPVSSMKLTLCQPIELNNTCSYVKADFLFFLNIGISHSTRIWLRTCYSFSIFSFLSSGDNECY